MRYIDVSVNNEHIRGAGTQIGAAGSHDAVALRMTFSEAWEGLTKRVLWIDARGTTRTETILSAMFYDEGVYTVPVPAAPLQYPGNMSVTVYGVEIHDEEETLKIVTEAVYFPVMESFYDPDSDPDGPLDIDPTIADQLQAEIDGILETIDDARDAAEDSEAWAVGQINGVDVEDTDPRYHNNSKYYAQQADEYATDAAAEAEAAEAWATGGEEGTPSATNNAKYYSEQAESSATTASTKAGEASGSAAAALGSQTAAAASATEAQSYAKGGTSSRTGEDTDNAKYYSEQAASSATIATNKASDASDSATVAAGSASTATSKASDASDSATAAAGSATTAATKAGEASSSATSASGSAATATAKATLAESWAIGGTGTRTGEDTNNAKYWSDQAQAAAGGGVSSFNSRTGVVLPQSGDYTAAMVGADASGSASAVQSNLDTHVGNTSNPHSVTAAQVGADPSGSAAAVQSNLDTHTGNTSNPHSVTAAQVGAIPTTQKGAANGVAELDANGKVPSAQLPQVTVDAYTKAETLTAATAAKYGPFRTQLSSLTVGDTISLKVNGADTDFIVVHQGKPSAMYDDSCDGTWLLMKDCYETRQWNDTDMNDYANSTIHAYLNSTFFGLFDSNVQSFIKQVKIPYVNGTGSGGSVASGANGLSTKVFLLGGYEVGFSSSLDVNFKEDGALLDYFDYGIGEDAKNKRKQSENWWLRSPCASDGSGTTRAFVIVGSTGFYNTGTGCSSQSGIRPAVILNSSAWFDLNDGGFYDSNLDPTPNDIFNAAFDKVPVIKLDGVWTSYTNFLQSTADALSAGRQALSGASVGNYAVFGGGQNSSVGYYKTVEAYSNTLVKSTPAEFSNARAYGAGASVGNYAVFTAGLVGTNSYSSSSDAYDTSLTKTTPTRYSEYCQLLAGVSANNYALFSGGFAGSTYYNTVNAYDSSLTRTIATAMTGKHAAHAGAKIGQYSLFAAGMPASGQVTDTVDIYDDSLTHTFANLSYSPAYLTGISATNYALFGGGTNANQTSNYSNVVAFDSSLTRSAATALGAGSAYMAGTTAGAFAVFCGGMGSSGAVVYDSNLTKTTYSLNPVPISAAGASVGNYGLVVGGYRSSNYYDTVYTFNAGDQYTLSITIPKWSKYKIDGVTAGETFVTTDTAVSATANTPFTGYIKRGFTLTGQIS